MKRKILLAFALCLMTLLCACGKHAESFLLYYPVEQLETAAGEGAIGTRSVMIANAQTMDTAELSEVLLRELLDTGIAPGAELVSLRLERRRVDVDFSHQYASLTGIDLTLADYCVTLTLTQLENVNAVSITAGGQLLPQRRSRILTAADPLLGQTEDTLRPVTVELYFWDNESETLVIEERTLKLYEGQSRVDAVLSALAEGPNRGDLTRSVPETLELLSARVEDGVCYLYLTGAESLSASAIEAIELSVQSLPNLREVHLALGGAENETQAAS